MVHCHAAIVACRALLQCATTHSALSTVQDRRPRPPSVEILRHAPGGGASMLDDLTSWDSGTSVGSAAAASMAACRSAEVRICRAANGGKDAVTPVDMPPPARPAACRAACGMSRVLTFSNTRLG